jgi:regulator of sigma E protease
MLITILATIVVLGVLILVHELGHFVTAKLADIAVPRFSIGLGPKLWGFRRGETEYVISWLPLGGYVKMAGMEEMEPIEGKADRSETTGVAGASDVGLLTEGDGRARPGPRDFESKSLPVRMVVISAGVLMNLLFAVVVFAAGALIWGVEQEPEATIPALTAEELPPGTESLLAVPRGARVVEAGGETIENWGDLRDALILASPGPLTLRFDAAAPVTIEVPANDTARSRLILALNPDRPPVIGQVVDGLPADKAGLLPGDRILAVAGEPVDSWQALVAAVRARPGEVTDLTIERGGRVLDVRVTPEPEEISTDGEGKETIGRIGAAPFVPRDRPGPVGALGHGVARTWDTAKIIVGFLGDLITGNASPRSLGGPILIGQLSGEVARAGIEAFLGFMALFSVNLAVLNLLPIPVLDGGHLLFLVIEAVRGRALSYEQRVRFTQVGFVIVLAIMVWAIANDVLRLFGI